MPAPVDLIAFPPLAGGSCSGCALSVNSPTRAKRGAPSAAATASQKGITRQRPVATTDKPYRPGSTLECTTARLSRRVKSAPIR